MVSGRPDSRNMAVDDAADDNQPVIRLLSSSHYCPLDFLFPFYQTQ
jgi:hypothetical protein